MLFRFLEYGYGDENLYNNPSYLAAINIKESYDRFLIMIKEMIGENIVIKDNWYSMDEIILRYNGGEDDLFSVDIYCSKL